MPKKMEQDIPPVNGKTLHFAEEQKSSTASIGEEASEQVTQMDMMSKESVGARVRAIRRYAGWSQRDMANFLGTDRELVSRWENGHSYPSFPHADALCNRFDLTMDYLFRNKFESLPYEVALKLKPLSEEEMASLFPG